MKIGWDESCKTCLKHARCPTEAKALRDGYDPSQVCCDDWQEWTKKGEEELKKKEREEG
ncbi:MAG: hypothetical protein PHV99_03750 [Candidatus Pacebacteria bacterium]|nr:hypothetical protein [Candidatus Paceibacterota bacterium]